MSDKHFPLPCGCDPTTLATCNEGRRLFHAMQNAHMRSDDAAYNDARDRFRRHHWGQHEGPVRDGPAKPQAMAPTTRGRGAE